MATQISAFEDDPFADPANSGKAAHKDPGVPAEQLAKADIRRLNQIEDPQLRMEGAAAIAAIAETQPAYKAALLADHQPEALEVAGHARFNVARYTPGKGPEVLDFGNDAEAAMLRYAQESKHDTVSALPAGGNVTLTDSEMKLDASRTSEGQGSFREQFSKEDGRKAFESALATLDERDNNADAAVPKPDLVVGEQDLARVAAVRARDSEAVRGDLGLNSLEPGYEREVQKLDGAEEAKRSAWLSKKQEEPAQAQAPAAAESGNDVESDEIFTAQQRDAKPLVPAGVEEQFVRKGDKFYNQPDATRLEFQDKGNKLETRSDGEQVAEALVRIAEARGWDEIKVHGSETFRREAWHKAAERGMHVKGYSPTEQDKLDLANRKGHEVAKAAGTRNTAPATKAVAQESPNQSKAREFAANRDEAVRKHPELAGAAAAAIAISTRAQSDGLTPEHQAVVQARVQQNLINSIERGNPPRVEIRQEVETRVEVETTRELGR